MVGIVSDSMTQIIKNLEMRTGDDLTSILPAVKGCYVHMVRERGRHIYPQKLYPFDPGKV